MSNEGEIDNKVMFMDFGEKRDQPELPALQVSGVLPVSSAPVGDPNQQAQFFIDLDSYTEYWDLYRPELNGAYMRDAVLIMSKPIKDWMAFAAAENTAEHGRALAKLEETLAAQAVRDALSRLDELLSRLIHEHFPSTSSAFDVAAYLSAIEAFARDLLPDDVDRDSRTPDGDQRKPYARRHRMDGESMWFVWGGVMDCAALATPGIRTAERSAQITGSAVGSAFDFVFRDRGQTRTEYGQNQATVDTLRSLASTCASDLNKAQAELRALYRVFIA